MAKTTATLLPAATVVLRQFGERLRLARLRRRLSAKQVAERAGMAPMTLRSLERGGAGVTMGAYLAVMQVLGIENDLDLLGKADPVGRALQDAELPARTRTTRPGVLPSANPPAVGNRPAPLAASPSVPLLEAVGRLNAPGQKIKKQPKADARDWIRNSGFASADTLAGLIRPVAPLKK